MGGGERVASLLDTHLVFYTVKVGVKCLKHHVVHYYGALNPYQRSGSRLMNSTPWLQTEQKNMKNLPRNKGLDSAVWNPYKSGPASITGVGFWMRLGAIYCAPQTNADQWDYCEFHPQRAWGRPCFCL